MRHRHGYFLEANRTFRIWQAMKARCDNKNNTNYVYYGGRGVSYCENWRTFSSFLDDMGECPEGMELDRIDNNNGYYKENCRWVTRAEQVQNSGAAKLDAEKVAHIRKEYANSKRVVGALAKQFGVTKQTIYDVVRLKSWS